MRIHVRDIMSQDIDKVYLDGVEVSHVIEFDTVAGWLIRDVLDENGHIIIENDDYKTETLYGVVSCTTRK